MNNMDPDSDKANLYVLVLGNMFQPCKKLFHNYMNSSQQLSTMKLFQSHLLLLKRDLVMALMMSLLMVLA